MGNSHGSIYVGDRRIIAMDSMWCPEGRWMIVWDRNEVPFLRKVVCVLPPILQAAFPVYAYDAYTGTLDMNAGHVPPRFQKGLTCPAFRGTIL